MMVRRPSGMGVSMRGGPSGSDEVLVGEGLPGDVGAGEAVGAAAADTAAALVLEAALLVLVAAAGPAHLEGDAFQSGQVEHLAAGAGAVQAEPVRDAGAD